VPSTTGTKKGTGWTETGPSSIYGDTQSLTCLGHVANRVKPVWKARSLS